MFNGIITTRGLVRELFEEKSCLKVSIEPEKALDCKMGDSISVSGACLTVTGKTANRMLFDISPETLERTHFCTLQVSSVVNLERPLRPQDFISGHLVAGHVDSVVEVISTVENGESSTWDFTLPTSLRALVSEKGSVALDGVSLTVNSVGQESFSVVIIPHTRRNTSFEKAGVGCKMNIEVDLVARYVRRMLDLG